MLLLLITAALVGFTTAQQCPACEKVPDIFNYTCSDRGLILPIFYEGNWSIGWRAFLYLVTLLYSFLGVAIAADVFMCSIEKITSKKKKIPIEIDEDAENHSNLSFEEDYIEVDVWNPTVANLTLMALGSSAPEILLSIIEIVGNDMKAGALGPGTIVGSAAFNLLAITAVCIATLPTGESRRINAIYVFMTTAISCVFAYLWILIVLVGSSPNKIEIWEAVVTLLFFPILVIISFTVDRKLCCPGLRADSPQQEKEPSELKPLKNGKESKEKRFNTALTKNDEWKRISQEAARDYPNLSPVELARIAAARINSMEKHDRLYYRIMATRYIDGRRRTLLQDEDAIAARAADAAAISAGYRLSGSRSQSMNSVKSGTLQRMPKYTTIEWGCLVYGLKPDDTDVRLKLLRKGNIKKRIMFRYETVNGSARRGEHYNAKAETLCFNVNEVEKWVTIDLNSEATWKDGNGFYVRLHLEDNTDPKVRIGESSPVTIRYTDSTVPPTFQFQRHNYAVKESKRLVRLGIDRLGAIGEQFELDYQTEDQSAEEGKDYVGGQARITFHPHEATKYLDIEILDDKEEEKSETFVVHLKSVDGVAEIAERSSTTVTIISDDATREMFAQITKVIPHALRSMHPVSETWKDQILKAISVNGGDTANANGKDIVSHILAYPWKLIFSLVPPTSMCGGWLTFIISLALIGILTAIVGDLAGIFGCLINLEDTVTAITFVALGTSLPDTFASRLAAMQDKYADNAVGNVTGSNSVNVFLGLGIPWLIASCYWKARDGTDFHVDAGSLAFSVAIYTIFSVVALSFLMVRRFVGFFGKAELGGPKLPAYLSGAFLLLLWILYVLLSAMQDYNYIPKW